MFPPPKKLVLAAMAIIFFVFMFQLFSYCQKFTSWKIAAWTRKDEMLSFLVVGDFGGVGREPFSTKTQRQVAKEMTKVC